jgi:PIN domain
MKPSVYIETTIPSYLMAWPSRDIRRAAHQDATRTWWKRRRLDFEVYTSQAVINEAANGDPEAAAGRLKALEGIALVDVEPGAVELAATILREARLPLRAATDALHIALATWHEMDFLLTWNCAHMNNAQLLPLVEKVCRDAGLAFPVICTPEELMGYEYKH